MLPVTCFVSHAEALREFQHCEKSDTAHGPATALIQLNRFYRRMSKKNVVRSKLVIVGDGGCGKTSDLFVFAHGRFPDSYIPTVFDTFVVDVDVDGQAVELLLTDTAGQEDFGQLRLLSYRDADVILLCFAIDSRTSFLNVTEKWAFEVRSNARNVPVLLVGNKRDIRNQLPMETPVDEDERPVETSEGEGVAQKIGARSYYECSAIENAGIRELFQEAARLALETGRSKSTKRKLSDRFAWCGAVTDNRCYSCALL